VSAGEKFDDADLFGIPIRRSLENNQGFLCATGRILRMKDWKPPEHWLKITTIDTHTEGEPL
jgi:hypothetical protein